MKTEKFERCCYCGCLTKLDIYCAECGDGPICVECNDEHCDQHNQEKL